MHRSLIVRNAIGGLQLSGILVFILYLVLMVARGLVPEQESAITLQQDAGAIMVLIMLILVAFSGLMLLESEKPFRQLSVGILLCWFVCVLLIGWGKFLQQPAEHSVGLSFYTAARWYSFGLVPLLSFIEILLPPWSFRNNSSPAQ